MARPGSRPLSARGPCPYCKAPAPALDHSPALAPAAGSCLAFRRDWAPLLCFAPPRPPSVSSLAFRVCAMTRRSRPAKCMCDH
eukprot:1339921-Rhodomonas_salina.1